MSILDNQWTERYRPECMDDYIFPAGEAGDTLRRIANKRFPPHLLLWGGTGTGKTTYARLLCRHFGITVENMLQLSGDKLNKVDNVRGMISDFVITAALGSPFKTVHLEEFEHASKVASNALRTLIEQSRETVFILTVNDLSRVDKAIQSRCTVVEVKLRPADYAERIEYILADNGVSYDAGDVAQIVDSCAGDLRAVIKKLEDRYGA